MEVISSASNQIVKYVKSLRLRKYRQQYQAFIAEGLRITEEALGSGWQIESLLVSEEFLPHLPQPLPMEPIIVERKLFHSLCETETPQGILAVVKIPKREPVASGSQSIVVLDGLQDPGNMGTIIRTADAFAADEVIASSGCVDLYNGKTLRATMGSIFHLPVSSMGSISHILQTLKQHGFQIYASHLQGSSLFKERKKAGKFAVIIGNEAKGISPETMEMADSLVKIPMPGHAESLNASIAAGILLYELLGERKNPFD